MAESFCEHCGTGPVCCVCGRDDRPRSICDVCRLPFYSEEGQITTEDQVCGDCCRRTLQKGALSA